MQLRRRVALVWGAFFAASLGVGCTALVGQFSVGGSADGGSSGDATMDQTSGGDGGGEESPPPPDSAPTDTGPHMEGGSCAQGTMCTFSACQAGTIDCDGGTSKCVPGTNATNGSRCDAGAVCDNGACVACAAGTDCSEAGSCEVSAIVCGSGMPACTQQGPAPNGQGCGTDLYCSNGQCKACTNGSPCAPTSKPCDNGSVVCADGGLTCNNLGTAAMAGTNCGPNLVCDGNGNCVSCTIGNQCNPPGNLCETGFTSCATGASTCTNLTPVGPGTTCGPSEVCDGNGNCISCNAGSACNPAGNTCQSGTLSCMGGTPMCTNLSNVMAGISCGASSVCNGSGQCVPICTAANCAAGCCNPTTQACTPYANQTSTNCGHGGGQCHSCAVGTSNGATTPACSTSNGTCAGTIIGQIGTYSDVTDLDTDGTNVYFIDQANEVVAQVSAYKIGAPVQLSPVIASLANILYNPVTNVVVFNAQSSATQTALYQATPNTANSATKVATVNGTPSSQGLAISSLGSVNVTTYLNTTTFAANNCTTAYACTALNPNISSPNIEGVTWPPNQAEPFWADYSNNRILNYVNSCGCYSPFAATTAPSSPISDSTYIYWLQGSGTLNINRQAISGNTVQSLGVYGANNQVLNLATDGKYLYWAATLGGVNGIYYMPIAGGTAQLLTTAGGTLLPVKAHVETMTGQRVVFWGDTGTAALMKVIAPP